MLVATQAARQVPGEAFLAKRLFSRPGQVLVRAVTYLLERTAAARGVIPPEAVCLGPILH
ncbi:hypothetical protein G3I76_38955, partial [Streptomyces sp. SID11233]|nr:hypothetical protein [Streptomyces sp. SID11233]